ncbi:hypothetical protein GCM10022393_01010 [Aquimarina addita]|uniref:PKD domain-containing protein n=1 Tax=Aquimarina addita TaxID=870485 RepID=A0ABP7X7F0_9FLAO
MMKRNSIYFVVILTFIFGFTSCNEDDTDDTDNVNECLDLFFSRDGDYLYADFEGKDTLQWYGWFINGEFVENEGTDHQGDHKLSLENLAPGTYTICLNYETPECPSPEENEFCQEIVIEESTEPCLDLFFSRDGDYLYADFEGRDTLEWYGWFIDDAPVEDEGTNHQGDHKLSLENLTPGTYSICLNYETPECPSPEENEFCQEIIIEGSCPELSFEAEQDGDSNAYYFYPGAFDGIDEVVLEWFANDEYIGQSPEFPHNNPFYYQFASGTYEICVKVETPDCPNGTSFCKTLVLE